MYCAMYHVHTMYMVHYNYSMHSNWMYTFKPVYCTRNTLHAGIVLYNVDSKLFAYDMW